jgi:hypothetical protein
MNAVDEPFAYAHLHEKSKENEELRKALKKVLEKRKSYQVKAAEVLLKEQERLTKQNRIAERAMTMAKQAKKIRDKNDKIQSSETAESKSLADFTADLPNMSKQVLSSIDDKHEFSAMIAVSYQFKNLPPLPASTKELAEELYSILTATHMGAMKKSKCKLLLNPSLLEFQTEMTRFAEQQTPTSSFFFCFVVRDMTKHHMWDSMRT